MIIKEQLYEIGFIESSTGLFSMPIGGSWFLHAFFTSKNSIGLTYGDSFDLFKSNNYVSIWNTFEDIEKLKQLIDLLKG